MLIEPIALSFANTHSSPERDRIATRADWQTWVRGWPGLSGPGHQLEGSGLADVRHLRDDVQSVLRATAEGVKPDAETTARIEQQARANPRHKLHWERGTLIVVTNKNEAARVLTHHLACATLELLLSPAARALRQCEGDNCLKVFLSTRTDKRWCDSTVCGNRARVRTYSARHKQQR